MRHLDDLLGTLASAGLDTRQALAVLVIGSLACVLWLYVYARSIYLSYRDKTTCIPTFAVCLNVTWELLAATIFEDLTPISLWLVLERLWLAFDVVILAQVFLYGPNTVKLPALKARYWLVVLVGLAIGLVGHYTFATFCVYEPIMLPDALVINLAMSLLFVQMFFQRKGGAGVDRGIAWAKMIGTQCNTVCMIWFVPAFYGDRPNMWPFMWFLAITIGLIDCVYIWLVTRGYPRVTAGAA